MLIYSNVYISCTLDSLKQYNFIAKYGLGPVLKSFFMIMVDQILMFLRVCFSIWHIKQIGVLYFCFSQREVMRTVQGHMHILNRGERSGNCVKVHRRNEFQWKNADNQIIRCCQLCCMWSSRNCNGLYSYIQKLMSSLDFSSSHVCALFHPVSVSEVILSDLSSPF